MNLNPSILTFLSTSLWEETQNTQKSDLYKLADVSHLTDPYILTNPPTVSLCSKVLDIVDNWNGVSNSTASCFKPFEIWQICRKWWVYTCLNCSDSSLRCFGFCKLRQPMKSVAMENWHLTHLIRRAQTIGEACSHTFRIIAAHLFVKCKTIKMLTFQYSTLT